MRRTSLLAVCALALASTLMVAEKAEAATVYICHKGKTIRANSRSLPAHKAHGDFQGSCDSVMSARLILSCGVNGIAHEVTAATWSTGITSELDTAGLTAGSSCAEALLQADMASCEQDTVFGESAAQTYTFTCPSADAVIDDGSS